MKTLHLLLCTTILSTTCGFSQSIVKGTGPFQLEIDVSRFYGDTALTYLELYYGIHENMLSYKHDSSRYIGATNMKLEVRNDSASVARKEWTVPHIIEDSSRLANSQTMMGMESLGLPPGDYTLTVSAYDVYDTSRKDLYSVPLRISMFPTDTEALSDIELCTSIQSSSNKQSVFYKNTLEVIPNAGRMYGVGLPIMYYYTEAYNLARARSSQKEVIVHTAVVDAMGKEVVVHDKVKPRAHNSSVEIGTVNLSALRGGTYVFKVSLTDSLRNVYATSAKKFFVYKPGTKPDSTESYAGGVAAGSEYAVMSMAELDREFDYARYISTETEREQYQKLTDVKARQIFLSDFWRRRDPDQVTPRNEFKDLYLKRVQYANDQLSVGFHQGWKTDRGRVYILYGQNDEVERFPSSSESNPYEVWHYNNLQGGVIFVFVDRNGLGDYILVHSTHRDEIHDQGWFQRYAQKMR